MNDVPMNVHEDFSPLEQEVIHPLAQTIEGLELGANLLVDYGNTISLFKYDGANISTNDPLHQRINRNTSVLCLGDVIRPYWAHEGEGKKIWDEKKANHPFTHADPAQRITKQLKANFFGTHRLDFTYDDEFGIYLVGSDNTDLYLNIANQYANGDVREALDSVELVADDGLIERRLREITRPEYFTQSIRPFLDSERSGLDIPQWNTDATFLTNAARMIMGSKNKPRYFTFDMGVAMNWLEDVAKDLEHGDFVYVGCKEEVYLFGVTKPEGELVGQGTYTTSTKPMLFFSNTFIGPMGAKQMDKKLWKGHPDGMFNSAEYRSSDPPGFGGVPYVFSAIGRKQWVKHTVFTGEPDIITGNIDEALAHFDTTDFSEFADIVRDYASRIREPTPGAEPNGDYFFY